MKHLNSFFVIGTCGMVITAVLHIILAAVVGLNSVHMVFFVNYMTFLTFLVIGAANLKKAKINYSGQ